MTVFLWQVVLGPVLFLVLMGFMFIVTQWVIDEALKHKSRTFGDLGETCCGRSGRWLFEGSQLLNMLLFMPVALSMIGTALQVSSEPHSNCFSRWMTSSPI